MERTISQCNLKTSHWETTEYTVAKTILEALLYCRDELLRYVTTLNNVDKLQVALLVILVLWLDSYVNTSEFTTTTRLLLISLTALSCLSNSLLVVNLWLTLVTLYLELTLQTVDNNIEVKLTHTRDNGLTTLLISTNGECWILLSKLRKTVIKLSNVSLALWLNCDRNHSVREGNRLEDDWCVLITESITSTNILETYTSTDITCID